MKQKTPFIPDSPDYSRELYPTVNRSVAFVDVAGFTAYTTDQGTHAGAQLLNVFRYIVRMQAGMHGVRVAKWLGDGVMIIGVTERPLLDSLKAIYHSCQARNIPIHAGVTTGSMLIFEGDDYIGKIVNTASRLADRAEENQILAYSVTSDNCGTCRTMPAMHLKGIGEITGVLDITPLPEQ